MRRTKPVSLALGAAAAVLIAVGCHEGATSPDRDVGNINAGVKPPPPGKGGGECAGFRLTGGGRTDQKNHIGDPTDKNTPESHDFATFGFQARPEGACPPSGGSGQLEWQEHDRNAFGGGFGFHGRVSFFTNPTDETADIDGCGKFGGGGTLKTRDGRRFDNVPFEVQHACDVQEPGRGFDHIKILIQIPGTSYFRHGILSGGNIQQHRLTGNN